MLAVREGHEYSRVCQSACMFVYVCVEEEASLPPRDDARLYWQTEEEEKRRRRFHDHQWEEEVS